MIQELKQQAPYDDIDSSQSDQKHEGVLNQGIWQHEQILKFMVFTQTNMNILTSKFQRRTIKIFKEMARFIGTRSSTQCRSQNQKLIKKHKNIKRILKAYEAQIGRSEFENAIKIYSEELKLLQSTRRNQKQNQLRNQVSVFTQTEFPDDSGEERDEAIKIEQHGGHERLSSSTEFYPFLQFPLPGSTSI